MTASSATSIMAQLKSATRAYHHQIADNRYARAIFAGSITPDDYCSFLARFYGFYAPVEELIAALSPWPLPDLDRQERAKLPLLAQDLRALGGDTIDLEALPRCRDLPAIGSVAQVLGCMYVFEGSTRGGKLIYRQIEQTLGLTPEHGCAFFACYRAQTDPMWKAFGGALDSFVATYGHDDAIIEKALATFEALDRWLKSD